MTSRLNYISCLVFIIYCLINSTIACRKIPSVAHDRKSKGDNGYRLYLGDEPNGYEPGKIYNLFLLGSRTHSNLQQFSHFMITAQAANEQNGRTVISNAGPRRVGRFQLFSDSLAQFNENCVNTISESDDLPKTEIQVLWVAPNANSGCVVLSAMVYENNTSWYADDGQLKKVICEKNPQKKVESIECCACDEAKYSFIFEGIWSNETHPKDYPFAVWLTHFSDVIGASHDTQFSFWGENHIASDGFRSLAEWGSVRLLEIELRAKAPRLKTLIKAGGLWYPDVNKNTSSHFKVDRKKHKLSLVSMFGPSPDWVVGINGLDLCSADCTWTESIDLDLHPWDAGTDSGITYMSPNSETQPRERMHQITTMYPEDPRAPFYDPSKSEITPLAKLYIRRQKVISRNCDFDLEQSNTLDDSENSEGPIRTECEVTNYSVWTQCSVTCGKGIRTRTREYVNQELAKQHLCSRQLVSREMCVSSVPECDNTENDDDNDESISDSLGTTDDRGEGIGVCKTTEWSDFSQCSATCGIGVSMRNRYFIDHMGTKKCPHVTIVEKRKCMAPECKASDIEIPDPQCPVGQWSDWSPCSVSCGKGVEIRKRLLLVETNNIEFCNSYMKLDEQRPCTQKTDCSMTEIEAKEICQLTAEIGPCRGNFTRYSFIPSKSICEQFTYGGCRGNNNNFLTQEDCMQACRLVITQNKTQLESDVQHQTAPKICKLTHWSHWSPCSSSCGAGRQIATRRIVNGFICPEQVLLQKIRNCYVAAC